MSQPTPTYATIDPSQWRLGNIVTTPKGLKKVDVYCADGVTKPSFQLWKPEDPYPRAPYGISEPFNNDGPGAATAPASSTPVSVKGMPLELKHASHLEFATKVDNALLGLVHQNQVRLLDLRADDEPLPLSMIRRQFCGFYKPSKKPEYAGTARIKVNVGSTALATQFLKRDAASRGLVTTMPDSLVRNSTVIPILEINGLWLSSTGGIGVTVQATQVLIMSSGVSSVPTFSGLEFAMDVDE
jgi:hypothetical protein